MDVTGKEFDVMGFMMAAAAAAAAGVVMTCPVLLRGVGFVLFLVVLLASSQANQSRERSVTDDRLD